MTRIGLVWIAMVSNTQAQLAFVVLATELVEVGFGLRERVVLDEVLVEVVVVTELVIIEFIVLAELLVVLDRFVTDLDILVAEDVELFVPVALLALHVHPS